jgi:CRISPR-associated protein Cas5d
MKGFYIEVSGPLACFTRPEMKVERVSYDVITPSAARAVFEAILWKPAIRWRVTTIEVLSPIKWISVRRNEVGKIMSPRSDGMLIEDERQQRAGLLLRDVRYRLHAEFDFLPKDKRSHVVNPVPDYLLNTEELEDLKKKDDRPDECEAKYAAMFERRARKGQCFNQPYLGCREFSCDFRLIERGTTTNGSINETRDLGWMLYDLDFSNREDPKPMFFRPVLKNGVINVPHPDSDEVRR